MPGDGRIASPARHPRVETFDAASLDVEGPLRLGLIALSTDLTFERDAADVLPHERAALHVTRVPFANPTTPENLRAMAPLLSEAAALLVPGLPLSTICYGCTAASVVIGDDAVETAIGLGRPGVHVVTPARAARRALERLGAQRIAVLAPYLADTTRPVIDYLEAGGFEVTRATCMGFADDRDIARVAAASILEAAEAADHPSAEALFLSCTALPACGLVERLEARVGKPVVTSNSASLWEMLSAAELPIPRRLGRLAQASNAPEGVA